MPYVLRSPLMESNKIALVLAFGRLSVLEACDVLGSGVKRAEAPTERVSVFEVERSSAMRVPGLAGAHKCAPLTLATEGETDGLTGFVDGLVPYLGEKSNLSVSGYGIEGDQYEDLVRSLLDLVRASGLKKVRLLRPDGNELQSEQVLSRKALDVVAFPYHGGLGMGPTAWVPDAASMRQRGTGRPSPHPDISMSPRLARVLLNLAGVSAGKTIVDPFCGSGTILAEARLQSLRCLGLDSRASRVQEARSNLQWLGGGTRDAGFDIRKADARDLPRLLRGTKVDAVVTEPVLLPKLAARPKTDTAETMIDEAAKVYSSAFEAMAASLKPEGRIVIVVPTILTMDGEEVTLTLEGRRLGLSLHQPGPTGFQYPVKLSFESTRWVRRSVYVFESRA